MQRRLDFLDFLRFIAAFSVLIQHGGEKLFPWFRDFSTSYFQCGVFGVTLFFLCSGFIIPVSLEKHGSLQKFWISRVFRLFPLYYASIAATLALIYCGIISEAFPSIKIIFWTLTMLMRFVGQPSIQGLYWTLSLEMAFYIVVSLLFLVKTLHRTVLMSVLSLTICLLFGVLATKVFHIFTKGWGTLFYLATMFTGTVFYKNYKQMVSDRLLIFIFIFATITLFANTFFNLYGRVSLPGELGTLSFVPVSASLFSAYLLFFICFKARNIVYPKFLLSLGVISYSLYLVQGLVFKIVPVVSENKILSLSFWILLIVSISYITYHYIEKPALGLGKRVQDGVNPKKIMV